MALRTLLEHPKFLALMALLCLARYEAMGLLETLFQFTGRFTPQGDIGKYADLAIAAWIGWKGDPEMLVNGLVDAGFLERSGRYRLVVHDWQDHAEKLVHTVLARDCKLFVDGSVPECGYLNQHERERFHVWLASEGLSSRPQGRPSKQPKTSQSEQYSSQKPASLSERSDKNPKPGLAGPRQVKVLEEIPQRGREPETDADPTVSSAFEGRRSDERPDLFAESWNLLRGSLPQVREFTKSRRQKVKARISQGLTLADFEDAVRKCAATPFLRGENERGWKASFCWLVENDSNLVRVLEGKYDSGPGKASPRSDVPREAWSDEAVAVRDAQRKIDDAQGYVQWLAMSEKFRRENPRRHVPEGAHALWLEMSPEDRKKWPWVGRVPELELRA